MVFWTFLGVSLAARTYGLRLFAQAYQPSRTKMASDEQRDRDSIEGLL
jgi:hypothetical protein